MINQMAAVRYSVTIDILVLINQVVLGFALSDRSHQQPILFEQKILE